MNARAPGQAAVWRLAWLLALCYALLVLASLHPYWLDLTRIDDDARAHLLPFVLPPADRLGDRLLVDYARAYVPLGYRWLFQIAAVAMAPLVFSRILGALLLTATWALAGRVGTQLGGRAGGIAGLLLAVHSAFVLENGFGGMYRGFALPLLLGWLSLMLAGRRKSAWSLLPVMALLYPQAFLVAGPAAGVDLLLCLARAVRRPERGRERALLLTAMVAGALAALALLPNLRRPAFFGRFVTAAEAQCMPEWWRPHGRLKFFPQPGPLTQVGAALAYGLTGATTFAQPAGTDTRPPLAPTLAWGAGLLGLAALLRRLARGERRLRPVALLAASALLLYAAARLSLFRLGWPDRFLDYPLAVGGLMAWPLAWGALPRRVRRGLPARVGAALALALPFALAYPLPGTARDLADDTSALQPLYRFIDAQLPTDALIAGWPDDGMDALPVYAHRAVLANAEMGQPMYRSYYDEVRERLEDSVRATMAFNADDPVFDRLRERWGVTHFLVEKRVFHPIRPPLIISPFRALARSVYDASDRERHLLYAPPPASRVYEDDTVILVDLSRLE